MDSIKNDKNSKSKVKNLLDYFYSETSINKENIKYCRAAKLELMINIYKSDLLDIKKAVEMRKIYKSSDLFLSQYKDLEEYCDDERISGFVAIIKEIAAFFQKHEQNNSIERGNELIKLEEEAYFEDYYYACEFVSLYINYDDSPFINDFLEAYGLRDYQFQRFVDIVLYSNEKLYDEYLEKCEENKKNRQYISIKKINNLYSGLTTGITDDGEVFDVVEYFKNVPFYDEKSAIEVLGDFGVKNITYVDRKLNNFVNVVKPEALKAIMDYTYQHNFLHHYPKMITEKEIRETGYIVNGIEISDEDKEIIIGYMKKNRIPFLSKAFIAVRDKYLIQGLKFEDEIKKKSKGEK